MSPKYGSATVAPRDDHDPVWSAALAALIDTTPDTEEELAAIEEVRRAGFRSTSGSVVSADIPRG